MYGLDCFSGYGGITMALSEWVKPVAYCESEKYAQAILLSRMVDGSIPAAPIWDDIKTLRGDILPKIDIVYGGFPCQDISVAGNGKGLEGERSGLFFELCRVVKEVNPRFVFLENVPGIRARGLREVVRELTTMGYDCRWTCVAASDVGAPHLRKRWFLLGSDNSWDTNSKWNGKVGTIQDPNTEPCGIGWWAVEPAVGRVVDGCPNRSHRIRALGNGVVPKQAKKAFVKLMGFEVI